MGDEVGEPEEDVLEEDVLEEDVSEEDVPEEDVLEEDVLEEDVSERRMVFFPRWITKSQSPTNSYVGSSIDDLNLDRATRSDPIAR